MNFINAETQGILRFKKDLATNYTNITNKKSINNLCYSCNSWLKKLSVLCVSVVKIFLICSLVSAQSGVLIPSSGNKPNPKILSLAVMNVEILIDNQHATVKVM